MDYTIDNRSSSIIYDYTYKVLIECDFYCINESSFHADHNCTIPSFT